MRQLAIAAAAASLAACTTVPAEGEPVSPVPDTCRADAGQRFVGQQATAETGTAIAAATRSRELRWVGPGMIVTMEYKFGRVTVAYDEGYRITRVSCG